MIIPWLSLRAALAADARYALTAEIDVPTDEPVRIDLTPAWVAACPDPSSYILEDARGEEVPYAIRTSDDTPPGPEALTWEPIETSPWSWTYLVHGPQSKAPVVSLAIKGLPQDRVIEVDVYQGQARVASGLLWNLPDTGAGVRDRIALPPGSRSGPWRVDLHTVDLWRSRPWAEFEALTIGADRVETVPWTVRADAPVVTGRETSRLSVSLPRSGLSLRGISVYARDPIFSRPAIVRDTQHASIARGELRRFRHGPFSIDINRIPISMTASRSLSIDLTDARSLPLDVERVEVELMGVALFARGGSPGRWTLSGCGPAEERYDLDRLSEVMHRSVNVRLSPEPPRPNPAWTLSLVTEGLAGPSGPLQEHSQPIGAIAPRGTGGILVRATLPPALLSQLRGDLSDLRLLDTEGRQIPYISEPQPPSLFGEARAHVSEEGRETVMRLALPYSGLPAHQLVLYAERSRFSRAVSVRSRGGSIESAVRWEGSGEEASRLIVPLSGRAGQEIEIRIDNGDNAPLPLLSPQLSAESADIWLVLPPGGASIHQMASPSGRPRYDLALLRSELLDGPAEVADIRVFDRPPPAVPAEIGPVVLEPSKPQRRFGFAAPLVTVCALLLFGLAIRVARTPEAGPDPDTEAG